MKNKATKPDQPLFTSSPPNESELHEFNKSSLTERIYYSLAEAADNVAEIVKCTPKNLLQYGCSNQIRLITPVPKGKNVKPVNTLDWLRGESTSIGQPDSVFWSIPDMLLLNPEDCKEIDLHGSAEQSDFKMGYVFFLMHEGILRPLPPTLATDFTSTWRWRVFSQGKPEHIAITQEDIFVTREELQNFIRQKCKQPDELSAKPESTPNSTPIPAKKVDANSDVHTTPGANGVEVPSDTENSENKAPESLNPELIDQPWLIAHEEDPDPKQSWYPPARFFARTLVKGNPSLADDRNNLAKKVSNLLAEKGIYTRDDKVKKEKLGPGTIRKAFSKVNLRKFIEATPVDEL